MQQTKKGISLPDIRFGLPDGPLKLSDDWRNAVRGSRVDVMLSSQRVMARVLDFPKQAADFLDGMIRSQIDRVTPWTAHDAAFGWGLLSDSAGDRIEVGADCDVER